MNNQEYEYELDDGLDSLDGLDGLDDEEYIYLESNEGTIRKFPKDYLKDIEFINTILISDKTAGRNETNTIILKPVDDEIFNILTEYINYHKTKDYILKPTSDINPNPINNMISWDKQFINKFKISESEMDLIMLKKLLYCANYLLYTSLSNKLCCLIAQYEDNYDYIDLFNLLEANLLNEEYSDSDDDSIDSEEEEKKN